MGGGGCEQCRGPGTPPTPIIPSPSLPGSVLQEDALPLQLHEELSACKKNQPKRDPPQPFPAPPDPPPFPSNTRPPPITAEALQDEVELAARLEGVDEVNDEGMLDGLQDVPLGPRVRRVLGVAGDLGLGGRR